MRAIRDFIIEADKTHEDKSEGGIILLHQFENQAKVIQHHKILAVPKKYQHIASTGDILVHHFNVITYDRKDRKVTKSKYWIKDNLFVCKPDMSHFVIKQNGDIKFLHNHCICEGSITKDDIIRDSGIIMPDLRNETIKKNSLLNATIWAKCDSMVDVEIGDEVVLNKYADYEITFPDGVKRWFVDEANVLYKV